MVTQELKLLIIIGVTIIIDLVLNIVFSKIISRVSKHKKKSLVTLLVMIRRIKALVLYLICIITCLFQIPGLKGLSLSILSGAGILSLVLGYAAQKTLANFFCGLGIAFSDPFEIGDFIKCVDLNCDGYVEDITLRHTIVRTIDNRRMIVPNSRMDEMIIENYNHTDNEVCRFVEFPVAYTADVDLAMKLLKEEMNKLYNPNTNGINKNVEFPKVRVIKWDQSSIVIRGYVWGADNAMTYENMYHLYYIMKKKYHIII